MRRTGQAGSARHCLLHPQHIPILAELATHFGEGADLRESKTLMKSIGGGIRLRNASDDPVDIFLFEQGKKFPIKPAADPLPGRIWTAGNAYFNGGFVGFLAAERSGSGVAEDLAAILGDQDAMAAAIRMLVEPRDPLFRRKWANVEGDVRVLNVIIVDLGETGQIGNGGWSDNHRFPFTNPSLGRPDVHRTRERF